MITYRRVTPADAPALAAMNHRLIRDEGHRNPMTAAQLEDRMRGWLASEYQAVVFEDARGPAGYTLFKREPEWVYLRQFFVEPERRRQGIGRAAIQWLLTHAWPGDRRIRLDVLVGNPAGVAFWRSVGFADYCVTMEREVKAGG
ncbi:MAG: GNAT family N-acetyltransferase [Planctomycetota bacterium]|nr:GNAT family N-acetyltransferase [Planctomycetota bacterium]